MQRAKVSIKRFDVYEDENKISNNCDSHAEFQCNGTKC